MKTRPAFVPRQIRLPRQMNLKLAKALGLTVSRIEQECRHHDTRAG